MDTISTLFAGRIDRKNYAIGIFLTLVVYLLTSTAITFFSDSLSYSFSNSILVCATVLFSASLHIRRFHDRGDSGWGILFMFIPIVGLVFFLILLFEKGEKIENKYGRAISRDAKLLDVLLGKTELVK